MDNEQQPLLRQSTTNSLHRIPTVNVQSWISPSAVNHGLQSSRGKTRLFLASKTGHYSVLLLVSLDVTCIFANFLIDLFACEKRIDGPLLDGILEALDIISLVFSCLFMLELLASIWAFGPRYFHSWFHLFDAFVIVSGFILDIVLKGIAEEAASLIVVLRLWRVFKIFEELTVGAQEQVDSMAHRIQELEKEVGQLRIRRVTSSPS